MADSFGLITQTPPSLDNFELSTSFTTINPVSGTLSLWTSPPYYVRYITFKSCHGGLVVMPSHTVTIQGTSSNATFIGSGYVVIGNTNGYYQISPSKLTSVEFGGVNKYTLSVPEVKFIIEPCSNVYIGFIVDSTGGGSGGNQTTVSTTTSCKVYPLK